MLILVLWTLFVIVHSVSQLLFAMDHDIVRAYFPISFPVKVGMIGHSFTRRMHDSLEPQIRQNFGLEQVEVLWQYKGGWTWPLFEDDPKNGMALTFTRQVAVAMVDIATNDLDSDIPVQVIADRAINIAKSLINGGVRRVVLFSVLYRHKRYGKHSIPIELFNARADEYNAIMESTLINPSIPIRCSDRRKWKDVWWWQTKKLNTSTHFSHDGVHLSEKGLQKYFAQVRMAAILAVKHFT